MTGAVNSVNLDSSSFGYDADGNRTSDGRTGLEFSYNILNLPCEIHDGQQNMQMRYTYLSDGTKISALDAAGNGLLYRGNFVYEKTGSTFSLESIAADEGRIVMDGTSVRDRWHVKDHLGNVRSVVWINALSGTDISARILEQNDYLPFGTKAVNGSQPDLSTNRYRYAGKEEQRFGSFNSQLLDFGARCYDPFTCRWTSTAPLAYKYFGLSPYNYCGNDPVNRFDPDGKVVIINGSEEFRQMYNEMREWLRENNCDELLTQLENNQNVTITIKESTSDAKFIPKYKRGNHLSQGDINLDFTHFVESNDGTWLSPSTQFMHEVDHATEAYSNFGDFQESQVLSEKYLTAGNIYNNNPFEFKVMLGTETSTAVALGEIPEGTITRTSHSGKKISIPTKCSSVKSMSIMCGKHNALLPMLKTDNEYLMYVSPVIR